MTRGKWVALAVGLAAIAVLVPYGPALWRAVAYVDERHDDISVVLVPTFGAGKGSTSSPPNPNYIVITRKRFNWLPGRDRMVRCAWCVESNHVKCPGREAWLLPKERLPAERYAPACDCPHRSHAQESE